MICRTSAIVKSIDAVAVAIQHKCKTWKCPHCRPKLRRKVIRLAEAGKPNRLITLTVNPHHFETPEAAAQGLVSAWRRAREMLKRYHGHTSIQFLAVFEDHKSGWPHLHILARCGFIKQKWLSRYMAERIASPIVDIRKVTNRRHAGVYVAKYIAKAPERYAGCKRYWTSADWSERPPKPARDPRARWDIWLNGVAILHNMAERLVIQFLEDGETEPFPHFIAARRRRHEPGNLPF